MKRQRLRLVVVALACAALTTPAPAGVAAEELPLVFSGRVEGTAVRYGFGAISTFVDPGSAYTFAKVDSALTVDGGRNLDMKAVGANVDPGTLVAAVIWAPGGAVPPETGLHQASTFPYYAEAFFPTPEGQTTRNEKCTANRDPQGSPTCRQADQAMYASAVVLPEPTEALPDETPLSARGFARSAGTDQGDLRIGETSAEAYVGPDAKGRLLSRHTSAGREIVVAGTPIVANFATEAKVVSTEDGAAASLLCRAVFDIAGQKVESPKEVNAALSAFADATGRSIVYTPPRESIRPTLSDPPGAEATCEGARLDVANTTTGVRTSYQFGYSYAVAAPLGVSLEAGTDVDIDVSDIDMADMPPPGSDFGPATMAATAPTATADIGSPTPAPVPSSDPADALSDTAQLALVEKRIPPGPLGVAAAAASTVLLAGFWLLIGVVRSLALGVPLVSALPGIPSGGGRS